MDNGTALEVIDVGQDLTLRGAPAAVLAEAQKAAQALAEVIAKKADPVMINGKQYLEYEDWQTCARFYGITAKTVDTQYVEFGDARGFSARAVAIRSDGMEISAAESMCLNDEARWTDRDLFQLKSMAQTRACAKALRNVLAWVVVLAGYGSTPAEELDNLRREAKHEVRPDGITTVKAISEKSGGGVDTGRRAWTVTRVTFTDGRSGSTFDKGIAEFAAKAKASGALVKPTLEQGEKGIDLTGLAPAGDAPQTPQTAQAPAGPPHPDDGAPIPEKILTIRKAAAQGSGKEWAIVQGSEREYVTDDATLTATLEQKKAIGVFMVFQYDWVAGRAPGSWARKLKGITDPPRPAVTETELPA